MEKFNKKLNDLQQQINRIKEKNKILCTAVNNCDVNLLQDQINALNINYLELVNKQKSDTDRYKQIIDELNTLYELIENKNDQINNLINNTTKPQVANCISGTNTPNTTILTCTNKVHKIVVNPAAEFIFITIVAGGGAGGIGFIKNMYYYSGGGGGAGACFIKKPIQVKKNYMLHIKIGKGGDIVSGKNGEDSYVKVIDSHGKCEYKMVVCGGKNGYPSYNMVTCDTKNISVNGGLGGSSCTPCYSGNDGCPGQISVPSQFASHGGNGGCSHFGDGGDGGGNHFNCGGSGGNYKDAMCGQDGQYGSGGGGSAPKINTNSNIKKSGNGGDGMAIIEWC